MVALSSPALPPTAALTRVLRTVPGIALDLRSVEEKDGHLLFGLGKDRAAVALMPTPIPWAKLDGPCATAWWWPEAAEKMQGHTSHILVALVGEAGNLIQQHITLTHLTAAIASHTDAVGIFWGSGALVHEPNDFIAQAQQLSGEDLPLHLWIDFRIEQNEDGSYRLFTTGMDAFGQLEIEIPPSTQEPKEILDFAHAIANYILTSNPRIDNGETLGRSPTEKVKAVHAPSMLDSKITVLRLEF